MRGASSTNGSSWLQMPSDWSRPCHMCGSVWVVYFVTDIMPLQIRLVTQLEYRLKEGGGECLYELGVEDDGNLKGVSPEELKESIETLTNMASQLEANVTVTGPLPPRPSPPASYRRCVHGLSSGLGSPDS